MFLTKNIGKPTITIAKEDPIAQVYLGVFNNENQFNYANYSIWVACTIKNDN